MPENNYIYKELSYKTVGILYEVYNNLGYGYKEKHYHKALEITFTKYNINFISQCPYKIRYKGIIIGRYYIDFVIEDKIVLEIKQGVYFSQKYFNQVVYYLKATKLKLGIIANFTPNGVIFRRVLNIY